MFWGEVVAGLLEDAGWPSLVLGADETPILFGHYRNEKSKLRLEAERGSASNVAAALASASLLIGPSFAVIISVAWRCAGLASLAIVAAANW